LKAKPTLKPKLKLKGKKAAVAKGDNNNSGGIENNKDKYKDKGLPIELPFIDL